jgi:hypothetical protein
MWNATVWSGVLLAGPIIVGCGQQPAAMVGPGADDNKPDHPIAQIMKAAHGGETNLARKLILGQISKQEKKKLIEYYEALEKTTPRRGSTADWQQRTSTLLAAAKAALDGCQQEKIKYRKAVDCTSCHDAHKATDD